MESLIETDNRKIFLDMDGVLADFNGGVRKLCGIEPIKQPATPEEDARLWKAVRKVPHFYDKLEPLPGSVEMFRKIREAFGDRCSILTGIPRPDNRVRFARKDKIAWVRRILSDDVAVHVVYRVDKPKYCSGKECILIDDFSKNLREWEAAGGTGLLFTGPEAVLAYFGLEEGTPDDPSAASPTES